MIKVAAISVRDLKNFMISSLVVNNSISKNRQLSNLINFYELEGVKLIKLMIINWITESKKVYCIRKWVKNEIT